MTNTLFGAALGAALGLVLSANTAAAREPGTPTMMPTGATIGVPVGANPPPGLWFSTRNSLTFGDVKDANGNDVGIDLGIMATVAQVHWVPGKTILGGDYRAMVLFPLVSIDRTMGDPLPGFLHGDASDMALGDITISPFNLSWMVSPGAFVSTGLSFGIPTGDFNTNGDINFGSNALTTAVDVGFSYLKDGWNLSLHANYFTHAENDDTNYRSGDEIIVNWTALKAMDGFSIGPVGYWRKQLTEDENNGSSYGGAPAGKAEQLGLGVGFSKRFGKTELHMSYIHDVKAVNAFGGDQFRLNMTMPLKLR